MSDMERSKDGTVDCPRHGRTGCLMLAADGDPSGEKRPVCKKCLAEAMVIPVRKSLTYASLAA